jgi:hypothetical protein
MSSGCSVLKALVLALALGLAPGLHAELKPIGRASVQVFDVLKKGFVARTVLVAYQPEPEKLQVFLAGALPGSPLNARVQVDQLPHYETWVARRKAEGGMAWKALSALLDELKGRPAVFLTLAPLPLYGPAEVRVGLLNGHRFELFGVLSGTVAAGALGAQFEPTALRLEKASAKAAWQLLAPLARSQAARMAGQR